MSNKFKSSIFFLYFILCVFFGSNLFAIASPIDHINQIVSAVKNHNKNDIIRITRSAYNYNYLFSHFVGNVWASMSAEEKNSVINCYNKKCVNEIFSHLVSRNGVEVKVEDQGAKIICKYRYGNDSNWEVLRFITHNGMIADIQYKGLSFLKNHGSDLKNKFGSCTDKKDFMNEVCR